MIREIVGLVAGLAAAALMIVSALRSAGDSTQAALLIGVLVLALIAGWGLS